MKLESNSLPPLSPAEKKLICKFNNNDEWTHERLMKLLCQHLQTAVEVELATIPLYLYTYYSIKRLAGTKPSIVHPETVYTAEQLFANQAGAMIMSVAVEEMLHLSLASNMLYAVGGYPYSAGGVPDSGGGVPAIYKKSPDFPANLPHRLGKDKPFHLRKFSYEQLDEFLDVELPEPLDAAPAAGDWTTIGQLYSCIRCLIDCNKISDADFRAQSAKYQIAPSSYSPNNTDTCAPQRNFNLSSSPQQPNSAANNVCFSNSDDSHAGKTDLILITTKSDALCAIATICDQGEGYDHSRYADSDKQHELSHYYKYQLLQSELSGYTEPPDGPPSPAPASQQFSPSDLSGVIADFPDDPKTADYPGLIPGKVDEDGNARKDWNMQDVSNFCNALYQYMLILTETIFKIPDEETVPDNDKVPSNKKVTGNEKRLYFNRAMHLSMIWMLDKVIQKMRAETIPSGKHKGKVFAPTFEDALGVDACDAYAKLVELGYKIEDSPIGWTFTNFITTTKLGQKLPDVSNYWRNK